MSEEKQQLTEVAQKLSYSRWLMNVGLVPEVVQENLYSYGLLSTELVDDVELEIDVVKKNVKYYLYMRLSNLRKYNKFMKAWNKYAEPKSMWQKWCKLRLLKNNIKYNALSNLKKFISEYIPEYSVEVEVLPYGAKRKSEQ